MKNLHIFRIINVTTPMQAIMYKETGFKYVIELIFIRHSFLLANKHTQKSKSVGARQEIVPTK